MMFLDRLGDGRRDEAVDRLAARDPLAHLARRDRRRRELERQHALAVAGQVSWGEARTRSDGEAHVTQDLVGLLPRREGGPLVGAHDEDRVSEAAITHRVDREGVLVERHLVGEVEREPREPQSLLGRRDHLAVARCGGDEDEQAVDGQLVERRVGEGDVADLRRVEAAAQDPRY